jgi:hypothetical protein
VPGFCHRLSFASIPPSGRQRRAGDMYDFFSIDYDYGDGGAV